MKDLTVQEAYPIVEMKWERIIRRLELNENTPSRIYLDVINMDDLGIYFAGCAYCELFRFKKNDLEICCAECPLNTGITCLENSHPYKKFAFSKEENDHVLALRYAKELLKLIRKTKPADI
jgi:hypothetical protein